MNVLYYVYVKSFESIALILLKRSEITDWARQSVLIHAITAISWLWNNTEMINVSQIGYMDNIVTRFISHTGDNVCGDMFVKRNCEHTGERLI